MIKTRTDEIKSALSWASRQEDPHKLLVLLEDKYTEIRRAQLEKMRALGEPDNEIYSTIRENALLELWRVGTGQTISHEADAIFAASEHWLAQHNQISGKDVREFGKKRLELKKHVPVLRHMRERGATWIALRQWLRETQNIDASVPYIKTVINDIRS